MKFFVTFLLCLSAYSLAAPTDEALEGAEQRWNAFKAEHGKKFSGAEESTRKANFLKADRLIEEHNAQSSSFKCAHNKLSDRTPEEIAKLLGARKPSGESVTYATTEEEIDPALLIEDRQNTTLLDLRKDKCLAAIKDQGQCGSCWTFSVIAPLEFASCKKKRGVLNLLSEQQIVDCDTANWGCDGGWPDAAYDYLIKQGGSDSQSSYPYTALDGTCKFSSKNVKAKVQTYKKIPAGSTAVTAMENALKTYGPLSVIILVQGKFGSYKTGIYDEPCPNNDGDLNHAVAVVGYGTSNGIAYWIVRNSWGTWWGDKGYILMRKGTNLCNVERYAMYVQASL